MRWFTVMGWLVAVIACCVAAYLAASAFGLLLALAAGAALLTVFIRLEELHAKQDNIKARLEELYELQIRNDDSHMPDGQKPRTLFVRCGKCNGKYEDGTDGCPYC